MSYCRELGYTVRKLVGSDREKEAKLLEAYGCSKDVLEQLYAGRKFLSMRLVKATAEILGVPVMDLIEIDTSDYDREIVHYDGQFHDRENREFILGLIDSYIDICEAVFENT